MRRAVLVAAVVLATASASAAHAADIALLGAGASKDTVSELIPAFEKASGHRVIATFDTGPAIRKRLAAGETYDVVITTSTDIDAFLKDGKLATQSRNASRTDLMKTGIGVAVRAGAPRPDISSPEALKRALLAAKAIGRSAGTSAEYIPAMLAHLGIADQTVPRLKQPPPGQQVPDLLTRGEVDIGLQQASELIHAPGIAYLGPLPGDLQRVTVYAAGIPAAARHPEAARALVEVLTGPAAAPVIRHNGMDPG
jgi:molybdate transport system substrate-binding protein